MQILITHAYSRDNKGDAAILSVQISEIKKVFPNAVIYVSSIDKIKNGEIFEGARMISSFMYEAFYKHSNKLLKLLTSVRIVSTTICWAFLYRYTKKRADFILDTNSLNLINMFNDSNLVIPIGGGYIRAKKTMIDSVSLILLLHPILLSILLKKPTVLYSQSIGPFATKFQRYIAKFVLNKANLIIARENTSVEILKKIGIKPKLIKRSVDAGFLFTSNEIVNINTIIKPHELNASKKIVGFTARNWLDPVSQDSYETALAKLADYIIKEKHMDVIFIPQVTADYHNDDDRKVSKRIIAKMQSSSNVWFINEKLSHHKIKAIYSNLDYIVGTRFHSVIFSLTSYVPAMAIEYEHKTSGILKDLKLEEWSIKIEAVDYEKLVTMFNKLLTNEKIYKNTLEKFLPDYIYTASQTKYAILEEYKKSLLAA